MSYGYSLELSQWSNSNEYPQNIGEKIKRLSLEDPIFMLTNDTGKNYRLHNYFKFFFLVVHLH